MSDNDLSAVDPFGAIADEFVEAIRRGQRPSVEEFARRYPAHAADIRDILPTLALMEQAKAPDDAPEQRAQARVAPPLRQLGDYEILREVGRGGMGVVYEARQLSLGRHVAIKVLPSHAPLDPRQLVRFHREAKAAAKLHHTNIVPVFGVGEQDGLPYYVMQFIQGRGLDVVLDELRRLRQPRGKPTPTRAEAPGRLTNRARVLSAVHVARGLLTGDFTVGGGSEPPESPPSPGAHPPRSLDTSATIRLPGQKEASALSESGGQYWQSVARVGMQVADALTHAASQGVLHRDIKPSNLLLDDTGNVWVTDFGLAKSHDSYNLTRTGDVVGTLRYMAPERFNGQCDVRSDVYSLGLTLYEMLVMRPAFDESDRSKLVRQVLHDEPPRPRKLNPGVPRDLETVVLKASARDPVLRYQTPAEMADDLRRFVEDRPVRARRVSDAEKLWRWCRRNPLPASLLAGIVLVFSAGFAGLWQWRVSEMGREDEKRQRTQADALRQVAETARDEARESAKRAEQAQQEAAQARQESLQRLIRLHVADGTRLLDDGDLFGALPWLTEALALDQGDAAREQRHRTRIAGALAQAPRLVHLWTHEREVEHVAFSPDGRRIVAAGRDHTARVWDAVTGEAVTPPLRHNDIVWRARFSLDGRHVVTAGHDKTARLWDASSGQAVSPALTHDAPVEDVSFSPEGRWVATASVDGTARVWDAVTGQPRTPPLRHASWLHAVSFSPDGRQVATASHDQTARVWDAATGQLIATLKHGAAVTSAAFSPDGLRVVTASEDHTARVWDAATGQQVGPPLEHGDRVLRAEFSPDGRYVATCSYDTTARVWDAATGRPVTPPLKHRDSVQSAQFSPDGRYVVTRSNDHTARVWEAATGEPVTPPLRHNWLVTSAAFSPDGRRVVTSSADRTVRLWEVAGWGAAPLTMRHDQEVQHAAFSPDGRLVVTASGDGTARVWDVFTGRPVTGPLGHERAVRHASFSADGRRVVTAGDDRTARVWDAATGRELIPPLRHKSRAVQAAFSPHGNRILTACTDGTAQLWDADTGAPLGPPLQHRGQLFTAAFSPDGRRVVTASGDGTARVWDAATGAPRTPPLEHQGPVEAAAFSPDGRRVVTASADSTARVWDAETGAPVTDSLRHGAGVASASFSPDGSRVVTGSRQGTARVWDAATGAPVTPLFKHGRGQTRVAFSPDGRRVATAGGGDYSARLWDADTGEPLGPPLKHRGWVNHLAFSPDGRRLVTACYDGTAWVWDLPGPDPRPLADLVSLAQLLSGKRVDATDGLVEVEPSAQRRALADLRARYPADFAASVPEVLAWHQREAEACLREKNGPAALFHLLHSRLEGWPFGR
jgi:WD40 repeat protein/serine/threonine protein kinase